MQHRRQKEEKDKDEVSRVSMDYFSMNKADEENRNNPMLVMINEVTGERFARAAGHKGAGDDGSLDWLIKEASEELKTWGAPGRCRRKKYPEERWRGINQSVEVGDWKISWWRGHPGGGCEGRELLRSARQPGGG